MSLRTITALLLLPTLLQGTAVAQDSTAAALTASDQARHLDLARQLSPEQTAVLAGLHPDFRILSLCAGRFSGGKDTELVLGIFQPSDSGDAAAAAVHRVGLIKSATGWTAHAIDQEIQQDEAISRSLPMGWQYTLDDSGFAGRMKCGVEGEFGEGSDLTHALGDQPFFDLAKTGMQDHKPVCFATDDIYNNWDCLVFSPSDDRFKLWYQQAHAD